MPQQFEIVLALASIRIQVAEVIAVRIMGISEKYRYYR